MEAHTSREPWLVVILLLAGSFGSASCSTLFGDRTYEEEQTVRPVTPRAVTPPGVSTPPEATPPKSVEPTKEQLADLRPGMSLIPPYLRPTDKDLQRSHALVQAVGALREGQLESCAMSLQQLRQVEAFGSEVAGLHVWVLGQMGDADAAEAVGLDAIALEGATPALAYAMAVTYELQERPGDALALYQDLSNLDSNDLRLIEACARTAVAAGDGLAGLRWLDRLLLEEEPQVEQRRLRAQALEAADRPIDALVIYRQLVDEFPLDGELLEATAIAGFSAASRSGNRGDWEQARDLQRQLADLDPQHVPAFYRLGFAERRLGNPVEAISAWRRCLEVEPSHVSAARSLAALLQEIGDSEGAGRVLLEVLRQPLDGADVDAVQTQLLALEAATIR